MIEPIEKLKTLKEIAETLNQGNDLKETLNEVLQELLLLTGLQTAWIFLIDENGNYEMTADAYLPEALACEDKKLMCKGDCYCLVRYRDGRLREAMNIINCQRIELALERKIGDTEGVTHHASVPLRDRDKQFGLLNVASAGKVYFDEEELNLLEAVAFQIGTAIQRIKLVEQEQENVLLTERSRLAQDLHDSVNQMLFSVSLTAKAAKEMTTDESLLEMIGFIQQLSQDALAEMKSLIWELRPEGLEKGFAQAVKNYAALLGLDIELNQTGSLKISKQQEVIIWRVVQEALNNCQKHADVKTVYVGIKATEKQVELEVIDKGKGFYYQDIAHLPSLGLKGMKARMEKEGGTFSVDSMMNKGTKISVVLPLKK